MDDWGIGIRFLSGAEIFNFFDIEIISGVRSSSSPISTGDFIPDIKQQDFKRTDHFLPVPIFIEYARLQHTPADVAIGWSLISTRTNLPMYLYRIAANAWVMCMHDQESSL